jgi:hypothetical protein
MGTNEVAAGSCMGTNEVAAGSCMGTNEVAAGSCVRIRIRIIYLSPHKK